MAENLTDKPEPNVSNETIAGFAIDVQRAQREIDEATGRKRAVLKRAKAAGVNNKAMLLILAFKKLDEDAVRAEVRDTLRYASVLAPNLPLSQHDLFTDLDTRPLTAKAQSALAGWDADAAGYAAGATGQGVNDCPHLPGTPANAAWVAGWSRGQESIAAQLGENARQADAGLEKRRAPRKAPAVTAPGALDAAHPAGSA